MLLGLVCGLWSCSAPNPNVRVERMPNGLLRVKGPLAGPFKTTEELAAHACELMTAQPGAANGAYGFEYCALHYYSHAARGFFLSYLSDIGGNGAGGRKYCEVPRALDDESHQDAIILGAAHSHPNTRKFLSEDTSELRHWRPTGSWTRTQGVSGTGPFSCSSESLLEPVAPIFTTTHRERFWL